MSEKTNADNKPPDSARLTRQQVQQNPVLKDRLIGSLKDNVFKKSGKIQRSPPGKPKTPKEENNQEKKSTSTGTVSKNPTRVETKTQVETTAYKKQAGVITNSKTDNDSEVNEKQQNNDSLLDTTFDLGKDERYSDIGGYLAEQSLIIGTSNDKQFSLDDNSKPSTSFTFHDTITNKNENLINLDNSLIATNIPNEQEIVDAKQNTRSTVNMVLPRADGQNPGGTVPPARPIKLNLKDVVNYVPEYDGKNMTPAEYIKKLKQVRSLIDIIDEENLTSLLKVRMSGEAEEALGGTNIKNLDDLINGIRTLYPIEDDIHEVYGKIRKIIQGDDETVVQYTNRLRKLVLKTKELKKAEGGTAAEQIQFSEKLDRDAAKSYRKGLKPEVKYELGQEETVQDISKAAIEIESDLKRRKTMSKYTVNNTYETYERMPELSQKILSCQICRDHQHEALFCRSAACVYCKGADHFSNNCRNVTNKIKLICKFCSQPGHSISACRFNKRPDNHCQYCQEMGHDVGQCPYIGEYEVCWKCKETGHNPNVCSNTPTFNVEKCEYCDHVGHTVQNCPDVVCKKCNKKGHTIKYCKTGEGRPYFRICTICENIGHEEAECEQARILVAEYKAKQQFKCQICEESGHTARFCSKLRNTQQNQISNGNSYNRGFQRKFCDYCKNTGHLLEDCRKLKALEERKQSNTQKVCKYCNVAGHTIDACSKIKMLESTVDEFCETCKNIGHRSETCFKNRNNPENFKTLSGRNA